jgi:hypothetical protein
VSVTITAAERDALYDELYAGLSGIDGVWLAASTGDLEEVARLSRQFSDDLRLLLDDLGWGEGSGESHELTAPPDVLRRTFTRLRTTATERRAEEETERTELRSREEATQRLLDACDRVLGAAE